MVTLESYKKDKKRSKTAKESRKADYIPGPEGLRVIDRTLGHSQIVERNKRDTSMSLQAANKKRDAMMDHIKQFRQENDMCRMKIQQLEEQIRSESGSTIGTRAIVHSPMRISIASPAFGMGTETLGKTQKLPKTKIKLQRKRNSNIRKSLPLRTSEEVRGARMWNNANGIYNFI